MDKKYQVFVSSTYTDLIEERKEVTQGLLESDCIPAGMELFPASNKGQWEIIKTVIDECDYYLLVIAGKYGSVGTDEKGNKVGYTEMEFDYALKTGKPIIAFIHRDSSLLPASRVERSKRSIKRLEQFVQKAKTARVIKYWDNKDNLKSAVITSINRMKKDSPATGWIKGDSKSKDGILDIKISKYEFEIESLKEKLAQAEKTILAEKYRKTNMQIQDREIRKFLLNHIMSFDKDDSILWDAVNRYLNQELKNTDDMEIYELAKSKMELLTDLEEEQEQRQLAAGLWRQHL